MHARERAHPVAGCWAGRPASRRDGGEAGWFWSPGSQARIKDGAGRSGRAVPLLSCLIWSCWVLASGCWVLVELGVGIAVSAVDGLLHDNGSQKERGTETLGDRQQSPRQVPHTVGIGGGGGGKQLAGWRGAWSQGWCQVLPNPTEPSWPEKRAESSRAHALHSRHAHTRALTHTRQGTTHSCCVSVSVVSVSSVSCQLAREDGDRAGQDRQYGSARYSQLIRIIECQAGGTEGTEWRRRGPLSLLVCALSSRVRGLSSSCLPAQASVSRGRVCVCVPPRAYRDERDRPGHGRRRAGWGAAMGGGSCSLGAGSWMLDAGCWEPDTTHAN